MEITQEHKTQIEEIISGIECPKDFECYKSGFENLCKTLILQAGEVVECLEESSRLCKFSFSFGSCPFEKPYPDEKLKPRLMNFLIC